MEKNSLNVKRGFTPSRSAFKDSASTGRTARQQGASNMTIRELWSTMPRSEKIGGLIFAIGFPILLTAFAVILP